MAPFKKRYCYKISKTMLGRKFYFTPASDRIYLNKAEVNDHVDSRMSRCWPTFDLYGVLILTRKIGRLANTIAQNFTNFRNVNM